MRDEVRVAPDRRREVEVVLARKAGVTDVLRRVVRLLERPQYERCERIPAAARAPHLVDDLPADLGDQVGRLLRAHLLGDGRCRNVQRLELLHEELDPLGVRTLVDPVERRDPALRQQRRHLLVGQDHQLLDQGVRLGLRLVGDAQHVAAIVELELRLRGLDGERAPARPALPKRGGDRARSHERVRPRLLRALVAGKDAIHLRVLEPRVASNRRAMERRAHDAIRLHLELDGHCVAVLVRHEAAGLVGQRGRQHRLDGAGDVDARATPVGLGLDRRARPHVRAHVRDVNPQPRAAVLAPGGDRVVVVARRRRVDRERRKIGQVAALGRDGLSARVVLDGAREAATEAAVDHDRLHHVARPLRVAQLPDDARATLAATDEHHRPRSCPRGVLRRDGDPAAALEERRGRQEAPTLYEDAHHRPVDPAAAAVGRGHSVFSTSVSSAIGSASSRRVRGLSRAFTSGLMPVSEMFSPLGR